MKKKISLQVHRALGKTPLALGMGLALLLAGCGGGGGGGTSSGGGTGGTSSFTPSQNLANQCATPRSNNLDLQGSAALEKAYLRSFIDETYLWYQDVPGNLAAENYNTPQSYFDVLKTTAKTASGALVDQFHWSQTTASWNAASSGLGEDYGVQWVMQASAPPRSLVVVAVYPGSPAALAGVKRGDKLTSIDGVDFVYDNTTSGIAYLNQVLSEQVLMAHQFGFNGGQEIRVAPAPYEVSTVQNVKTIATTNGTVGYFIFNTHIAKSEGELVAAIQQLKAANVSDLVIDMRYNGGGLLYIASELAYMVAGPANTSGKVFERLTFNDKLSPQNRAYPFYSLGVSNPNLPHLDLKHVTILTTRGTASASESVINGLRGADVVVYLIGTTTRGKPYGFIPQDNCGYTYFAIQFKGVNQKNFGDYADGFSPNCTVTDDFNHERGDTTENVLKTALSYRQTGVCPARSSAQMLMGTGGQDGGEMLRPPSQEMRILTDMPRS